MSIIYIYPQAERARRVRICAKENEVRRTVDSVCERNRSLADCCWFCCWCDGGGVTYVFRFFTLSHWAPVVTQICGIRDSQKIKNKKKTASLATVTLKQYSSARNESDSCVPVVVVVFVVFVVVVLSINFYTSTRAYQVRIWCVRVWRVYIVWLLLLEARNGTNCGSGNGYNLYFVYIMRIYSALYCMLYCHLI